MSELKRDVTVTSASVSEQPSSIQRLVENLVDVACKSAASKSFQGFGDEFSCCQCSELLYLPVTGPCGYSFCATCAKKEVRCNRCETKHNRSSFTKLNVVLYGILERWYPVQHKVRELAADGDKLLEEGSFKAAESKFTEALEQYPRHSYALIRRAIARKETDNWKDALRDIVAAKLRSQLGPEFWKQKKDENLKKVVANEESLTEMCLQVISENISCTYDIPEHTQPESVEMVDAGFTACDDDEWKRMDEDSTEISPNPTDGLSGSSSEVVKTGLTELTEKLDCVIADAVTNFTKVCNDDGDVARDPKARVKLTREKSEDFDDMDFCCILCTETFYDPVSTPCGHTFCLHCLERAFDHGRSCPVCKTSLKGIYQFQKCYLPMDKSIDAIIRNHLPELSAQREELRVEETGILRETLPVFVCVVALPTVRCYLHVFEPRYRLMIRRATRVHDGVFGMTINSDTAPFHNVGTIVNIENVFFYQDGRSIVTSVGSRRFEVQEYSTRDGYNTAKIKYIIDQAEESEDDVKETKRIAKQVYGEAKEWWNNRTTARLKSSVRHHYGDFPELDDASGDDGPVWPWWVVAALPLKEETRAYILAKNKLRERLGVLHIILGKI